MDNNIIKLFFDYFEFLNSNEDIDISSSFNKYKIYLKDEKEKINNFFNKYLKVNTFSNFDVDNFNLLLENIYVILKVLQRQSFESKNPYMIDDNFLDNIIKSLAIEHPELVNYYVKPKFSHDIVNMFKRKGTIETIKKAMSYFYLLPIEIFEMWLVQKNNELFFEGRSRNYNYIKNTDFDINLLFSYNAQTSDDPHWYLQYDNIKKINNNLNTTGLGLPSLTPYIRIVNAPNIFKFRLQYLQIVRNIHYEYNYFLENNDISQFRLLYHNDTESFVSITEIFLLFCYLYNKRYYREFEDDKNSYFQYSNITNEFDENEYSQIDKLTRKYEYDELKKQFDLYSTRPLLKTDYSTKHGFINEKNKFNFKISSDSNYYRRLLIKEKEIESNNLFNYLSKNVDYSIFNYGNNIIISGGGSSYGLTDYIVNTNIVDFNSFNISSIKLPIKLHKHVCLKKYNKIIVFGGKTENNVQNDKLYYYDYNSDNWYINQNVNFIGNIDKTLNIDDDNIFIQKDNGDMYIFNINNETFFYFDIDTYLNELNITIQNKFDIDWDSNNENVIILFRTDKIIVNLKKRKYIQEIDLNVPNFLFDTIGLYFDSNILNMKSDMDENLNSNSFIFINNSNEIKVITDNYIFISKNVIFENEIYLIWDSYIYKKNYNTFANFKKVKIKNNYYLFFSNSLVMNIDDFLPYYDENIFKDVVFFDYDNNKVIFNFSNYSYINNQIFYIEHKNIILNFLNKLKFFDSYFITFETENISENSYDEKTSLKLISDLKKVKKNNKKVFTFEDIFNSSNRHASKENKEIMKRLFQQKGDSYLYKDSNFDTNLNLRDLIDINNDDFLIDNIEQIKNLLILLNDKFSDFIDSTLLCSDLDFNKRFFNIVSLIDTYIKIFFQEDSYFSQYYIIFDQNVRNIIDKYKPIITRYNCLTTALNFKFENDDYFINDEYFTNILKENSLDFYNIFDYSYLSKLKCFIHDLPYIPERTRKYDRTFLWRNEFHDLQLKEINKMIIFNSIKDILIENTEDFKMKLIMNVLERVFFKHGFSDDESIYDDLKIVQKMNINEKIFFNYSFENNKPVYDNVLFNRSFNHDNLNVCDYLQIEINDF